MSLSPGKVLAFLVSCLASIAVFSLTAERVFGPDGKICFKESSFLPCIRFYTVDEITGFREFSEEKEIAIREQAEAKQSAKEEAQLIKSIDTAQDSLDVMITLADKSEARFWLPENNRVWWDEVFSHWESLMKRGELYRILHYGDSQIEMDRITATLRSGLQHRFGGGGPGLVPPLQLIPAFTISQTSSDTWKRFISYGVSKDRFYNNHYGPLGMVFPFDSGYAHVSISARLKNDSTLSRFDQVKLITGRLSSPLGASLISKGEKNYTQILPGSKEQMHTWDWAKGSRTVNLAFSGDTTAVILGIALDSKAGIIVDNIPWRGSSGLTFTSISKSSLSNTFEMLDAKMVILQFGGNSVPYFKNEESVRYYVKSFVRQIEHLKAAKPGIRILVIGPADMSYNEKGDMATYPLLEKLVEEMRTGVNNAGTAFWSMYDAMGGRNSMVDWVNQYPALAAPDYIHFTQKGSELIADKLLKSIEKEYEIYRKKKSINEKEEGAD